MRVKMRQEGWVKGYSSLGNLAEEFACFGCLEKENSF